MGKNIKVVTKQIIKELYNDGNVNKRILANVRVAPSMSSTKARALWPLMMKYMDKEWLSTTGVPTKNENAIYSAIRMYALYQQGQDNLVDGTEKQFFEALRELRNGDEDQQIALDRRVEAILSATEFSSLMKDLVQIQGIMKSRYNEKIDYAKLANDLYWFQVNFESMNRVKLVWGQMYFR